MSSVLLIIMFHTVSRFGFLVLSFFFFFFFNDTATTEIYPLSLPDALPISLSRYSIQAVPSIHIIVKNGNVTLEGVVDNRSEEHTSELQSLAHLVCRLL